jgi:ankyrin repeat protein
MYTQWLLLTHSGHSISARERPRAFEPMLVRKRYFLVIALLLALVSFTPAAFRTAHWAGDAQGLITLASIPESEHSFNPFYWDSYLVSPDMAVWMLESFDWPYRNRDAFWAPPLHQSITAHSNTIGSPDDASRLLHLVKAMLTRGEDIDAYSESYTPLLLAILHCDLEIVQLLAEAGANPELRFMKPGSPADKMNALEFAAYLQTKEVYCSTEVHPFLMAHYQSH